MEVFMKKIMLLSISFLMIGLSAPLGSNAAAAEKEAKIVDIPRREGILACLLNGNFEGFKNIIEYKGYRPQDILFLEYDRLERPNITTILAYAELHLKWGYRDLSQIPETTPNMQRFLKTPEDQIPGIIAAAQARVGKVVDGRRQIVDFLKAME
jgi:hypothetical protein